MILNELSQIYESERDAQGTIESAIEKSVFNNKITNKSLLSDPIFIYKLPEIDNLTVNFNYNFFTRNEREIINNENEEQTIIESNISDNFDIDFLFSKSRNRMNPRYVNIRFKKPSALSNILPLTNEERTLISNASPDDIITESSEGNPKNLFFGFELTDRGTEQNVIDKLRQSSLIITNTSLSDQSYTDLASSMNAILNNPGGITGEAKKVLLENISSLRSQGFAVSPDENSEILSTDPISNENFSIKINKLFAKDVTKYATTQNSGLFEEELTQIKNYASVFRENAIDQINLSGGVDAISERDQAVIATPIYIGEPLTTSTPPIATNIKLAGYLIDKVEQLPNETLISRRSIFITNPDQNGYVDTNVRYGGKYIYKIRPVYLFEAETVLLAPEDPTGNSDQAVMAKFLVASSGTERSVFCVENIPPRPPAAIRCRFNFKIKKPIISWQFPLNKQRDIKRFQVFKRANSNLPFTLIAEYNFDNSITPTNVKEIAQSKNLYNLNPKVPKLFHIDTTFNSQETPIYAVASVDAHGLTSNLSTQIQIKYNKYENRLHKKMFSREGAPKPYPNIYMEQDTFLDNIKISGSKRMTIFLDPEYYRVFKNNEDNTQELDLDHIAANPQEDTYKFHIINLDQQKDNVVNVRIEDASSDPSTQTASNFNAFRYNIFQN